MTEQEQARLSASLDAMQERLEDMAHRLERLSRWLRCAECGRLSDDDAAGWRTYLTDDEPPETETFCPECSEREFGDA